MPIHILLVPLSLLIATAASAITRRIWAGFAVGPIVAIAYTILFDTGLLYPFLLTALVMWNLMSITGGILGWSLRQGRPRAAILAVLWSIFAIESLYLYSLITGGEVEDVLAAAAVLIGTLILGAITVFALPPDRQGAGT